MPKKRRTAAKKPLLLCWELEALEHESPPDGGVAVGVGVGVAVEPGTGVLVLVGDGVGVNVGVAVDALPSAASKSM